MQYLTQILKRLTVGPAIQRLDAPEPSVNQTTRVAGDLHVILYFDVQAGHYTPRKIGQHVTVLVLT